MRILCIGGTGEIPYEYLRTCTAAGHRCTVFNRGREPEPLPEGVTHIIGDITDPAACARLACEEFDIVGQFRAFSVEDTRRDIELFSGHCGQYDLLDHLAAAVGVASEQAIGLFSAVRGRYTLAHDISRGCIR
ncbi:MAG: hypothetical protein ABSH20_13070 [Tepidisphaeraceae bacterium]|jgi:nucleoside-diphosphate-sugar epimerase